LLSIGLNITAFNRIKFTEQCLLSILWSKPQETVVCLVDNGSTDGTRSLLIEYQKKYEIFKHVVFNKDNLYVGGAINQGWKLLSASCDVLGNINNDFLVEPGWDQNVRACIQDFNLDYVVGTIKPSRQAISTPSGGRYSMPCDNGGAVFLKTAHFLNGFYPSIKPFSKDYVGPGPAWHKRLRSNLKGVRLASPGVLVRDSEYLNPDYIDYYDATFETRNMNHKLKRFRMLDKSGNPRGVTNWNQFLEKYYPEKMQ